jgi:hypothetical protein
MKQLNLVPLVHEGPMARAYLAGLQSAGWRIDRLVLMVQRRDPATQRPVAPWLPQRWRCRLARSVQDLRMNYWSRQLLREHAWCRPWLRRLALGCGIDPEALDGLTERPSFNHHATQVDEVLVDGLNDPALHQHLAGLPPRSTLLFTGGGMVPEPLLSLPGCRFLHVHPGVLPEVRGADGLLWSVLLRGRPGATAFYLSPGLDTGDIILADDLPLPLLPAQFATLDAAMRYRLLYAFVDPLLRAQRLLQVVQRSPSDLFALPTTRQDPQAGTTFHFMNPRMRLFALDHLQTCAPSLAGA